MRGDVILGESAAMETLWMGLAAAGVTLILTRAFSSTTWLTRWSQRGIYLRPQDARGAASEVAFGTLVGLVAGLVVNSVAAAAAAAATAWLMAFATRSDLLTMRIPREPCWAIFMILIVLAAFDPAPGRAVAAVLGVGLIVAVALVTAVISRGGLGSGDVRFLLAIAPATYWFGVTPVLLGLLLAAGTQIAARMFGLIRPIEKAYPFAPALSLGFLLAFAWSAATGRASSSDLLSLL